MKTFGLYLVLANAAMTAMIAMTAMTATAAMAAEDDSIQWLGDYREALRQAKQTHKPIFVEFRCEA